MQHVFDVNRTKSSTPFILALFTINDFLSFGLLLAQFAQSVTVSKFPPVGRILVQLQKAWLYLFLLSGAKRGVGKGHFRWQSTVNTERKIIMFKLRENQM